MKQEFKRNALLPSLFIICALMFGFAFILQMITGNPVAFMTLIVCILMTVNAIWGFSLPVVTIDEQTIELKEALLKQRKVAIKEIQKIDFSNDKYLDIYSKNNSNIRVRYNILNADIRYDFEKVMKDISKNIAVEQ